MISLINYRRDHLLSNKEIFKNEGDLDTHIENNNEIKNHTNKDIRMNEALLIISPIKKIRR